MSDALNGELRNRYSRPVPTHTCKVIKRSACVFRIKDRNIRKCAGNRIYYFREWTYYSNDRHLGPGARLGFPQTGHLDGAEYNPPL
ncbi:MAG: hypothetical protein ACK56F_23270, partial [bacterium]